MIAIDVYDLSDEQLDAAVGARRTHPDAAANIQANREWDAYRRRVEAKAEAARLASLRRCSRCGIDTTASAFCQDCVDVLALEAC